MSQILVRRNGDIFALILRLAEGFYLSVEEGGAKERLEQTLLMAGDEIVFNTTDKTIAFFRGGRCGTRILWNRGQSRGDDKFYLGSNQTEDFLIVARFIGLSYNLCLEVVEKDESRVFARFV